MIERGNSIFGRRKNDSNNASLSFSPTVTMVVNRHAFARIAAKKSPLANLVSARWVPVKFAISLGAKIVGHKRNGGGSSPCRFTFSGSTA